MRKRISFQQFLCFFYFLFNTILFFSISPSIAVESVTLQLKWKHQFQFAGYYAAIEKGYYKQEDLDVTLIEGKPGRNEVDEVISGRANFGVGMADTLLARLKGEPVVILANIFQHSPSVLLAIKGSGVSSPQDLFNKKIMMTPGYKSAELQAMLANEGIPIDKIKILKPNWKLDDLIDGKVAAMAAYISSAPYFLKKKNIPYITISPTSYGIDFYGDNLFTSEQEINQHPNRVRAFKKASLKGWQYALEHPEEIIDVILLKYTSDRKNLTKEFLNNEASTYQKLILPKFVKIGHVNPGRWKHIADTYVKLGMTDKDYSLEGLIYDPDIAKFDWGHWAIKLGIGIIIAGFASTLFLIFFNRRLNREIYDRKQAEDTLRKSEAELLAIYNNSPMIMLLVDEDRRVLKANRLALKSTGRQHSEIEGLRGGEALKCIHIFDNPDGCGFGIDCKKCVVRNIVLDSIKTGSGHQNVEAHVQLDLGNGVIDLFFLVSTAPLNVEGTKTVLVCLENITDRKQAGLTLRENEEKYRILVENANDAILVAQDGVIKFFNKKTEELTGYLEAELIKRPLVDLIHPDDTQTVIESYKRRLKGEKFASTYSFKIVQKSGLERTIHLNAVLIQWENKPATLNFLRDITQQTKLESQLQQAQKMESIGTLAGGIAHDFNNILSSVIGYTELALDGVDEGSDVEDDLQEVRKAGMRAKDLVKQILTFARQSEEKIQPIQVNIIAKEVVKFLKSSIPTSIQIKNSIISDSLIMGSPTQIHQILMNLCTNAAQAMEENGGILEISVNDTTIDKMVIPDLKLGEYIEIKVSDTGIGISPQNIQTIFEPYFTTKPVGEGTGMGLAVVHGIVENYGGQITVDSTIGKGTCFTIYLPITKNRKVYTRSEKEDLPLGNENILFVDDEAPIAKMGSKVLEQLGYAVTARTSSIEALELFRSKPQTFDLVISDMTMPNMTGDKLAIELMKVRSDIPVVLCTGYSKKISEESAADIGIKALVYKPVVKADLAKTVRKVLDEAKNSAHD